MDALNKGLTLEVQSLLTRQLMERLQQQNAGLQQNRGQQQQQQQQAGSGGAGAGAAAGAAEGAVEAVRGADAPAGEAGSAGAGGSGNGQINMQEEYDRIKVGFWCSFWHTALMVGSGNLVTRGLRDMSPTYCTHGGLHSTPLPSSN